MVGSKTSIDVVNARRHTLARVIAGVPCNLARSSGKFTHYISVAVSNAHKSTHIHLANGHKASISWFDKRRGRGHCCVVYHIGNVIHVKFDDTTGSSHDSTFGTFSMRQAQ